MDTTNGWVINEQLPFLVEAYKLVIASVLITTGKTWFCLKKRLVFDSHRFFCSSLNED